VKALRIHILITLLLVLAVSCNILSTSPPATPEARSAQLSELKEAVEAQERENTEWQTAIEGQTILGGGSARTGEESRARLDISDGTLIRLGANTVFKLLELSPAFTDPVTKLKLDAGKVWVQVTAALGLGSFEVETPVGVAGVRGSLMSVEYDPVTGQMIVTCLDGECRLTGSSGAFSDLTSGQQSEIGGTGLDPTPAHSLDSAQLVEWDREFPEARTFVAAVAALPRPTDTPTPGPTLTGPDETPDISSAKLLGVSGFVGNMRSAFDGQGTQHLFYTTAPAGDGNDELFQQQLKADGTWTAPQQVTTDFGGFSAIIALPDSTKQMCVYWNGEFQGTPDYVRGLFRSCQNEDGTWPTVQEPLVTPPAASGIATVFALRPAPDGGLSAVYVTLVGRQAPLYFTHIDPEAGPVELSGTQLSGDVDVKKAQLAVDAGGGYHIAWVESTGGRSFTVQYRYSDDAGKTWSEAEQFYSGTAAAFDYLGFQLVADRIGYVHLAWEGDSAIFYRRWAPASGWEEMVDISQGETSSGVRLAVTSRGLARALWNGERDVWYGEQSPDGTWKAQVVTGYANDMALAVDADGLSHLIWNDGEGVSYATIREVTQASGPSGDSATPTPRPTLPPPTPPFGGQGPADIPGFGAAEDELVFADQDTLIYLIPAGFGEKAPFAYQDLMPLYGWTLEHDGMTTEGATTTMVFTKEGRTATIVFSPEPDGRTRVTVEITTP
jgi:hypothetical protein